MSDLSPHFWLDRGIAITADGPAGRLTAVTNEPFARLGSHASSDVVLEGAEPRGVYLHAAPAGIFCLDLRGAESADNFTGWLTPSAVLQLGSHSVTAAPAGGATCRAAPTLPTAQHSAPPPWPLLTVRYKGQEHEKVLQRALVVVGRGSSCYFRFANRRISNRHCVLYTQGGRLWVIDLFSTNGTQAAGRMVDAAEVLVGETIDLGVAQIEFTRLVAEQDGPAERQRHGEPQPRRQTELVQKETPAAAAQTDGGGAMDDYDTTSMVLMCTLRQSKQSWAASLLRASLLTLLWLAAASAIAGLLYASLNLQDMLAIFQSPQI